MLKGLFHSTAMVSDYDRARDGLQDLVGLRVLECTASADIGRRGGMTWVGDNSLEIGEPLGAGGAVGRFVVNQGGGMHSIALEVDDLDRAAAELADLGVPIISSPRPGFFFTDPRATGGVYLQWAHFAVPEDPRQGGELPPLTREPLLTVTHKAYIGAVVTDPPRTAELLARIIGTDVCFENPPAARGHPQAGVSLGDCTLALFEMPDPGDVELWGRSFLRPRTHLLALVTPELAQAEGLLEDERVAVRRREEGLVVLEPGATGDVPVAFVEQLLPGDPRLVS